MKNKLAIASKIKKASAFTTLIIVVIFACLTFAACDPGTYIFKRDELSDVVSIELIDYDNPNQKHFWSWVPDHTADLKPFDNSKASIVEKLDESKISDFLDSLCDTDVLDRYYAYDSPNGLCIKLTYANGDFLIINYREGSFAGYIGIFTADGEVSQFIGCFSSVYYCEHLINDFFETNV